MSSNIEQAKTGFYKKFIVHRVDGRDQPGRDRENAIYLVLDLVHDENAASAVVAYAQAVRSKYPELAKDLMRMVGEAQKIQINKVCEDLRKDRGGE